MQGGFPSLQFGDQLFRPVNRDLIQDGSLYLTVSLDRLVDIVARLAHGPPPAVRREPTGPPVVRTTDSGPFCSALFGNSNENTPSHRNNVVCGSLAIWRLPMPRYFFDVKNGHRLFDATGFVCDDDTAAIIRATVLAIGVSLDTPEDDPERRVAIINDAGREIGTVPVYSRPSYENPA
jgi:hypothetical protein